MSATLLHSRPRRLTLDDLTTLVRLYASDEQLWRPHLHIPDVGTDRWWTRLSAGRDVDVWLLSWLPGHTTELHDHGNSSAAFAVVEGELSEVRAVRPGLKTTHQLKPGSATWVAPGVAHDVTGAGSAAAVSIHAYSPPLTAMNYYDDAGRISRTVQSNHPEEELVR